MRTILSRTGARFPVLGQGTWEMGERPEHRSQEVAALQLGFELGMTLVDTAEMYANGGAEEVLGEALRGRREKIFVVSKVLPHNASYTGTLRAAESSLRRLGSDWIDLYLLHWPGAHPVETTLEAFETLRQAGKIRHYGLSNFDVRELETADALPGGHAWCVDQVLFNLGRRGPERRLLPWCREREIVLMAYSPLEQGRLQSKKVLREVARRHDCSTARIALAWTIHHTHVMAIPKAADPTHVRDNATACDVCLTEEDLADLDTAYPIPKRDHPLETL